MTRISTGPGTGVSIGSADPGPPGFP